jgi:hypothetical protein
MSARHIVENCVEVVKMEARERFHLPVFTDSLLYLGLVVSLRGSGFVSANFF